MVVEPGPGGPLAGGALVVVGPLGTVEAGTVALPGTVASARSTGEDLNVRISHRPITVRATAAADRRIE